MENNLDISSNIIDITTFNINKLDNCILCQGVGLVKYETKKCNICEGRKCIQCKSKGFDKMPYDECEKCYGTGKKIN